MGWGWDDLLSIPTLGAYSVVKRGVAEPLYNKLYKEPADQKKSALDQATAASQALGQDVWGKAMQGKNEALAQYAPADAAYQALYGDPKSWSKAKAPVAPGNGGMY